MPSKQKTTTDHKVVTDLDGYRAYKDGDVDYQDTVDAMTSWLNGLPYGTKIVYDEIEYHKPEYRFNFWYEKGYTIGCSTEHTVFPNWFAQAAGGDQTKVTVKSVPKSKPKVSPVPDNGVPEIPHVPGGVEGGNEADPTS